MTNTPSPAVRRLSWAMILLAVAVTVLAVRHGFLPSSSASEDQPAPTCAVLCANVGGSGSIGSVAGSLPASGSGQIGAVG